MIKMGAHDAAIALLSANAEGHPRSASSAFSLGRAYADAGFREKALAEFGRALELDPGFTRAADALQRLEK